MDVPDSGIIYISVYRLCVCYRESLFVDVYDLGVTCISGYRMCVCSR